MLGIGYKQIIMDLNISQKDVSVIRKGMAQLSSNPDIFVHPYFTEKLLMEETAQGAAEIHSSNRIICQQDNCQQTFIESW